MSVASPCPKCGSKTAKVKDSRNYGGVNYRRRRCDDCSHRWSTAEIPLDEYKDVQAALAGAKDIARVVKAARVFKNELELLTMRYQEPSKIGEKAKEKDKVTWRSPGDR